MTKMRKAIEQHETSSSTEVSATPNIVSQPQRLTEVMDVINLMGSISEKVSAGHGQFVGSTGIGAGGDSSTADISMRDQAIANLPTPPVMQKKLLSHIDGEISTLVKAAKRIATSQKAGWAYKLTEIYARIRRLSALAAEILQASIDVLERFYILVFIDKQPLLAAKKA